MERIKKYDEKIDSAIIKVSGSLDIQIAPIIRNKLRMLLDKKIFIFIIDCTMLTSLSAQGLSPFMEIIGEIKQNEGDIIFAAIPEKIYKVFKLSVYKANGQFVVVNNMKLTDTFNLPRASRYSNPKNGSDILPYAYGDLTYLPVEGGVWNCVQIDDDVWLIAANVITDIDNEPGVELKVYDDDGEIDSSEYDVVYSGDYESTGLEMSYLIFSTSPNGQVRIQCKGKSINNTLLENPITIIEDLSTVMNIDESLNVSSLARAKLAAQSQNYTAAGVIQQDKTGAYWLGNILFSFLGDWWPNNAKEIMLNLETGRKDTINIAGFLNESAYIEKSATQSVSNLCNQPLVYFGPNFTNRDRHTSSGASKGDFDGYDDGISEVDPLSQWKYGIQQKLFEFYWIRSPTIAQVIQELIVELFSEPLWLFTVKENAFCNLPCERGDYVVASYKMLPDENGLPLRNQIWKILEIGNSDAFTLSYLLKDMKRFYQEPPIYYDGTHKIGKYPGRVRERRIFPL